jgi:REP element-mobilizing transposase RayT
MWIKRLRTLAPATRRLRQFEHAATALAHHRARRDVPRGHARGSASPIVHDDRDRESFLDELAKVVREHRWRCHAYCLMTNHYHLLVRTPEPDLSAGMQKLNLRQALRINRRHGFAGHVFEGRFFAELVEDDAHFVALSRYIDQNPVRAGLCRAAELWPWSGCAATLGLRTRTGFFDPTDVLSTFSSDIERARTAYALSLQDFRRPGRNGAVPTPGVRTAPV